jgi:uncharacterized protein YndB with AHSA1/START domain
MKNVVKGVLVLVLAVVLGVLGLAALQPASFEVKRSIQLKAPVEKVYPLLVDFQKFGEWSPWEKLDPAMKRTFEGPASGVGAVYSWRGNDQVGEGRMEITAVVPDQSVTIKLDFLTPFESHNTTVYALQSQGANTTMTWSMTGPSTFATKVMTLFVSMDAMVGPDFERGLANLRAVVEKG